MGLTVDMVTIDCLDPKALSGFWSRALGVRIASDDGDYVYLARPGDGGPVLSLQRVPEPRAGKNRVHMDLRAGDRAAEVDRLVGLGASIIDQQQAPGLAWTVLADPEGNEFCVGE